MKNSGLEDDAGSSVGCDHLGMTKSFYRPRILVFAIPAVALSTLAGCQAGYDQLQSDGFLTTIDGTLWRQIATIEDPLSNDMFGKAKQDDYLDELEVAHWSGDLTSVADLRLADGGAAIYDVSTVGSVISYSVFISSGPRDDGPTDDGEQYLGPDTVYTCYGIKANFHSGSSAYVDRLLWSGCPEALVDALPDDALFVSDDVFDG